MSKLETKPRNHGPVMHIRDIRDMDYEMGIKPNFKHRHWKKAVGKYETGIGKLMPGEIRIVHPLPEFDMDGSIFHGADGYAMSSVHSEGANL